MKEKTAALPPARVALTITELNVGGAERCLTNLALGLDQRRFAPFVVSLGPRPAPGRDQFVSQLSGAGVPVHFLGLTSWRQFPAGLKMLQRLYQEQMPQVVQTFLFHANVLGARAVRRAGVPALFTGVRVADPRRCRLLVERFATTDARRIVCVSRSVADFIIRRGGFPPSRIEVIPNGINLSRFDDVAPVTNGELEIPDGRRFLAVVGRLDPQKGLDWLLSLAPRLLDRATDHDLVIVGDGPERRRLEAMACSLEISGRVHFAGWRPDVPQILAASDALLLPSRWEGMPNVVLEAMASRLPVVATRTEGIEELLGNAAEAQTAVFGDDAGFLDQVVEIATDSALARVLGEANRCRAEKRFSLEAMIAAYEKLYSSSSI